MSTVVRWGQVSLENVLTLDFVQTSVRDESNTDLLRSNFRVTVETIANLKASQNNFGACGITGATAPDLIQAIRSQLTSDREKVYYEIDGIILLTSDTSLDLDNGPKAINVSISNITKETIRIRFTFECSINDCYQDSGPPAVVNNRWSCSDDFDEHFRITRSWRGKLRVATVISEPNQFRNLCVPVLCKGYRRIKMHFTVATNGLDLGYEVTDQQMLGDAPPIDCTHWEYTHSESLGISAINNTGEVSVRMFGYPRSDKGKMIQFGAAFLTAKFGIAKPQNGISKSTITSLMFIEQGGDSQNSIEVRGRIQRVPTTNPTNGLTAIDVGASSLTTFGRRVGVFNIPNYNQDVATVLGPLGTDDPATIAAMFTCFLQSPCSGSQSDHSMPQAESSEDPTATDPPQGSSAAASVTAIIVTTQQLNSLFPVPLPGESPDHQNAMYHHCRIESRLEYDGGVIGCPIARSSADPSNITTAFVQLHQPTCVRKIRYEAERTGQWPLLWKPTKFEDSQGINYQLKSWTPIFQGKSQTGDGQTMFTVDAEYVFLMDRPPGEYENIATAVMPWDTFKAIDNVYPTQTMIDPDDANNGFG